jgi:hypothetical protein
MKKTIIFSGLLVLCAINMYGQWYVDKYDVTDIDYLTQQELEESIHYSRQGVYGSLVIMGMGGAIVLIERFFPYEADDENMTLIESILGEKGMRKAIIAGGVGVSAAGVVAGIVYLGRLGTLKSALRSNFPSEGSLSLSPTLFMERTSHNLYPGVTLTYNF